MKYLKTRQHALYVSILILCATCLRVWLAAASWPLLNSDEGTMGVIALHIQQGAHPIFFYGQNYMGVLQAYIAACLFSLFGASIFTLRLAIILFYGAFLITMYVLTRMLYSKRFALFVLFLLSLGSNAVLSRELSAIGGYSETIFFSALAFVLVGWLALSTPDGTRRNRLLRLCAYSAWGLTIGLGLWSDLLILPTVACSGFFLVLFRWRELLKGYVVPLVLCLIIGMFPLIVYNLRAAPGLDSWSTLMAQQGHIDHTFHTLIAQIKATTEYSIPAITGSPLCHHSEFQFLFYLGFQPSHPADATCANDGLIWSGAYLSLFILASILVLISLYRGIRSRVSHSSSWTEPERHIVVRNALRFCVLLSTFLTLYLYTTSTAPLVWPSIYSRYLICIWISTPMVLWPVWEGISWVKNQPSTKAISWLILLGKTFCITALVWLAGVMLFGTYITINEIPMAINANRMEQNVIATLLKERITHVYSGYWTCDRIAFESQDRITCGVVNNDLTGEAWNNRYQPYYDAVKNDPHSAYIFEQNNDFLYFQPSDLAVIEKKLALTGKKYRRILIENYAVYEPMQ